MYRFRCSRLLALTLAAVMCLSLTACKSKQNPGHSSSASGSQSVSSSAPLQVETPLEEILNVLAQKGLEEYALVAEMVELDDLITHTVDGRCLVVLRQTGLPRAGGTSNLIVGVWDEAKKDIVGEVFTMRGDDGRHAYWKDQDGLFHVLLVNSATHQGYEGGSEVKYFTFDGVTLTQVTQLPDNIVFEGGPFPEGWEDAILAGDNEFWLDLKAVPYPGGMELFSRNPDFDNTLPTENVEQWVALGYVALDGVPLPNK